MLAAAISPRGFIASNASCSRHVDDVRKVRVARAWGWAYSCREGGQAPRGSWRSGTGRLAAHKGVRFETAKGNYLDTTKHVEGESHVGSGVEPHELCSEPIDRSRMRTGGEVRPPSRVVAADSALRRRQLLRRGDVLIGADGLKSTVREQIHGPAELRSRGYAPAAACWRPIPRARCGSSSDAACGSPTSPSAASGCTGAPRPAGQGLKESPAELKRTVLERFRGLRSPSSRS